MNGYSPYSSQWDPPGYSLDSTLAVVTGEAAPELTDDGRAIAAALSGRGFETTPVVWSDESVDWTNYDVAVLRSCWNYPTDPDRFRGVLDAMATADVAVVNPPRVVRWNLHKSYLFDLQAGGVQIPATELIEPYLGLDRGGNTVERFRDAITGAIGRSG